MQPQTQLFSHFSKRRLLDQVIFDSLREMFRQEIKYYLQLFDVKYIENLFSLPSCVYWYSININIVFFLYYEKCHESIQLHNYNLFII